jgi:hypothetical protein
MADRANGSGTKGPNGSPAASLDSASASAPTAPTSSARPGRTLSSLFDSLPPLDRRLALQAAASVLSGRLGFSQATGFGFDAFEGLRDLFVALGFKRELTISDYRERYRRGGIAKALIDLLPDEMWDDGVYIRELDYDSESPSDHETKSADLWKRLGVESRLLKADKLAGLGRYSIVLIGIRERSGNTDLSQPLPRLSGPDDIVYLRQFAEDNAKVLSLVADNTSPRFLQPEFYEIQTGNPKSSPGVLLPTQVSTSTLKVHWTRIIHVAHGLLESDWLGTPDLEASYNDLESLYKVSWGGSEAAWRRMDPGTQWDLDPEYEHTPEKQAEFREQIQEFRHNLRRDLFSGGIKATVLAANVDKFESNINAIVKLIGGTHRIPYTILLSEELGLRAGENNRDNLDILTGARRKGFGEPLVRQFQDRMIEYGALPKPRSGEYVVSWGVEEENTEIQKAELAEKLARANQLQSQADGSVIWLADEIRDKVGDDPMQDRPEPEEESESESEPETDENLEEDLEDSDLLAIGDSQ